MPTVFADLVLAFFIGMGPVKIIVPFLAMTRHAPREVRVAVARRTVLTATAVAAILVLSGLALVRLLHLSDGSLLAAGGIVIFAVGIRTVLDLEPHLETTTETPIHELLHAAVTPLGVPTLLNPAGISAAILLSAEIDDVPTLVGGMAVVGLIALLDLVVLWWISSWAHHVATEAILVAERILGMLLVALGIQLTIIGLVRLGILAIPVPT